MSHPECKWAGKDYAWTMEGPDSMDYSQFKWGDEVADTAQPGGFCPPNAESKPTEAEMVAEVARIQGIVNYVQRRVEEYPESGDQFDDLYKAGAFSANMAAKIKKVKDDNPKP